MKRSIITASVVFASLAQSLASAQIMDLPDPGADTGGITHTPVTPTRQDNTPTTPATQYAGSLRLEKVSRKTGGQVYKLDLAESYRLQKIDVRVATSRLKIHRAVLVTDSGSQIILQQLTNSAVLETSAVLSSEALRSNERIKTIELTLEGYSGDTDVIVTAVADAGIPKLSLRQEVVVQQPVVQTPVEEKPVLRPFDPSGNYDDNRFQDNQGSVVYYGHRYEYGETVLYRRQYVVTVNYVYDGSRVSVIFEDGYERAVPVSDLSKALRCKGNLCVGMRVTYANTYQVEIMNVFENGIFVIRALDGSGRVLTSSASSLSTRQVKPTVPAKTSLRCTTDRRICVGDSVNHPQGYVVTVTALYSNGTADVRDAAGAETVRTSSLRPIRRNNSIIRW